MFGFHSLLQIIIGLSIYGQLVTVNVNEAFAFGQVTDFAVITVVPVLFNAVITPVVSFIVATVVSLELQKTFLLYNIDGNTEALRVHVWLNARLLFVGLFDIVVDTTYTVQFAFMLLLNADLTVNVFVPGPLPKTAPLMVTVATGSFDSTGSHIKLVSTGTIVTYGLRLSVSPTAIVKLFGFTLILPAKTVSVNESFTFVLEADVAVMTVVPAFLSVVMNPFPSTAATIQKLRISIYKKIF